MIEILKHRIRALVEAHFAVDSCRAAVLELLGHQGYALHEDAPCRAGVLSLESYRAVRGTIDDLALNAAAAVELHMAAAYALDDVIDAAGPAQPQALAVSLQLLACGYTLACEAARGAGTGGEGFAPLLRFHRNWATACDGFFLDANSKRRDSWTLEDALDMTVRKSGALGRFAAAFGAGVAADKPDLVERLGDLGEYLFTYRQLVDDLRDACAPTDGTSDLCQGKRTLPLVYFYNYLAALDGDTSAARDPFGAEIARAYAKSGASVYGAIVAETFLNRAKASLADLQADDLAVRNIAKLVATIEAGSCDAVPN